MYRDFSDASKQRLLELVEQVEGEKWCDFTDWIGDRWLDFQSWIGRLNIKNYINNVNEYHKKVIDKNNTTKEQIEKIFADVTEINELCALEIGGINTMVEWYKTMLIELSQIVAPGNGMFEVESIEGFENAAAIYLQSIEIIADLNENRLSWENIKSKLSILNSILSVFLNKLLDKVDNIGTETSKEFPVGLGIVLLYKAAVSGESDVSVDIKSVLEEHRFVLREIGFNLPNGAGIEIDKDGNVAGAITTGDYSSKRNTDGTTTITVINQVNGYAVKDTYEINPIKFEAKYERSISSIVNGRTVTSTAGIRLSSDSWIPIIPATVPKYVPYKMHDYLPEHVPEYNIEYLPEVFTPLPKFNYSWSEVDDTDILTIGGNVISICLSIIGILTGTGGGFAYGY